MSPHRIPIVLTATIRPHETPGIHPVRQSEEARYREYAASLAYLARRNLFGRIILVENSGSRYLEDLRRLAARLTRGERRVEVHGFPVADPRTITGKGYGEGLMLERLLRETDALAGCDSFAKATGRYRIRNLFRIVPLIEKSVRDRPELQYIYFNPRRVVHASPVVAWASTAFFWTRLDFWNRHLADCYVGVDDMRDAAYESVIWKRLCERVRAGDVVGESLVRVLVDATSTADDRRMQTRAELWKQLARAYAGHWLRGTKGVRIIDEASGAMP